MSPSRLGVRDGKVKGAMQKREQPELAEKLGLIGRMLGAVRLLDMMLTDEGVVEWYVEEFFKGNYAFEREQAKAG